MIRDILAHFDAHLNLPVSVNDVRDLLQKIGRDDEISFHLVDMDVDVVRGVLHSYIRSNGVYAELVMCAEICIAKDQPDHWRRLVAVKEMLHTVDSDAMTASEEETVESLFECLALPPEIRPENVKRSYINDKTRIILALAVLIPKPFREKFSELVSQNVLTHMDVAKMAGVPARFIPAILSDGFEESIQTLIEWEEDHQ